MRPATRHRAVVSTMLAGAAVVLVHQVGAEFCTPPVASDFLLEGDPAPGTNARFDLDVFGFPDASPTLNNAGEFIFYGELVVEPGGATEANRRGIWMWQNNDLHLLIRSTTRPAPSRVTLIARSRST